MNRIFWIATAGMVFAAAATSAQAAQTGSGTVDFTFTAFHGPFRLDVGFFTLEGQVNGGTPIYNGNHLGELFSGDLPISGQSVAFSYSVVAGGVTYSTYPNNIISFTSVGTFTDQPRGVPFKIGTFTFTNADWLGGFANNPLAAIPSYFDYTLTTHSPTAAFNQTVHDSVKMTVNVADCSLPGGPEDQADFISIAGAPQLGSLRVYDSGGNNGQCTPAGMGNTGSIDLYMKFNSLDYVGLRNPRGGFYSASAVPGPLGVPEPASWALMIAGFGLAGSVRRRRTKFA